MRVRGETFAYWYLRRPVHRAIKRRDIDRGILDARLQQRRRPHDLALPRQEDQDRTLLGGERRKRRLGDFVLDAGARVAADIAGIDGKGAAFTLDQRRLVHQRGHAGAIHRRRHDKQA